MSKLIYLNSANLSKTPSKVLKAQQNALTQFEENPTQSLKEVWGRLWNIQKNLAKVFHANPFEIFFRSNVTQALNEGILGLSLNAGDEILISEFEYGAIYNIARWKALNSDATLRVLRLPSSFLELSKLTKEKLCDLIVSQFTKKTKVLILSHVLAGLGYRLPIERLAEETHEKIHLIVDGAYAPGAIDLNFKTLNKVDYYGASLYKWFLGPKGTGFGWIPKSKEKFFELRQIGWTSFESHSHFTSFGEGDLFQAQRMLSGCQSFAPFLALEETLKVWQKGKSLEALQQKAEFCSQLVIGKLGWQELSPKDPSLRTPMKVFILPQSLQKKRERLNSFFLKKFQVQLHFFPIRSLWHVVFSPHIYNSDQEIETAINRVAKRYPLQKGAFS